MLGVMFLAYLYLENWSSQGRTSLLGLICNDEHTAFQYVSVVIKVLILN
jgi:hypothetical protein